MLVVGFLVDQINLIRALFRFLGQGVREAYVLILLWSTLGHVLPVSYRMLLVGHSLELRGRFPDVVDAVAEFAELIR